MLKECVHNQIDNYSTVNNYKEMYKIIEKYKYVSFDIFDTLVKRDVPKPSDIFNIVGSRTGISDFKNKRVKAEEMARQSTNGNEVNLDDIYSELSYIPNHEIVKKVECQVEIEECVINKDIIDFFNYCVKHKNVLIITDMYLPRHTIESILSNNQIYGYDELIISNEENSVKSNGGLFEKILSNHGIDYRSIIHIGNSMRADYIGAKKAHIKSIKIPTYKNRSKESFKYMFSNQVNHDYLMSFINNHIDSKSSYYNFGYQCFGPLLYGFIDWLRDDLKKSKFDQVLFMARDGYIMKKVYDQVSDKSDIKARYFEASRRSLRVPTYDYSMDYSDMLNVLTVPNLTNPTQILDSWGLDPEKYSKKLLLYGFELTTNLKRETLINNTKFKEFFKSIKDDIFVNSANELETLEKYLKKFNFNKKTAIVDIGWGGSMQNSLIKTLDKMNITNNIYGYYIGLTSKSLDNLKKNKLNAKGYAFDAMNNASDDLERPFVGLFETLFLEQAGSVKKYIRNDNRIEVERYQYEYINNGKEVERVKSIQAGALKFNFDFYNSCTAIFIGHDRETMFSNLYRVGVIPSLYDVSLFGKFDFFNNGTKVFLANPKSILYYLFHLKVLRTDLYNSQWKVGFLKQLLKFKMDYKKIFDMLRKVTN